MSSMHGLHRRDRNGAPMGEGEMREDCFASAICILVKFGEWRGAKGTKIPFSFWLRSNGEFPHEKGRFWSADDIAEGQSNGVKSDVRERSLWRQIPPSLSDTPSEGRGKIITGGMEPEKRSARRLHPLVLLIGPRKNTFEGESRTNSEPSLNLEIAVPHNLLLLLFPSPIFQAAK